jgi:cytochrome c oxidase assembly protein subunit 15
LLLVTVQAIFGGLRVTEISNGFAVIHGCLAQIFFCLLILIALLSSRKWGDLPFVTGESERAFLRIGSAGCFILVVVQLVFGASMRHYHRSGLADDGILKTAGAWIPSFDDPVLTFMFLHKLTAVGILLFVVILLGWSLSRRSEMKEPSRHLIVILTMLFVQVGLGVFVILSGKNFWITNFHVLNGLAILALVFVLLVRGWRGKLRMDVLASSGEQG